MTDPSQIEEFGPIAEEFLTACRQGEEPQIDEYAARFPACAQQIRELLPMLAMMEQVNQLTRKSDDDTSAVRSESMVGREIGDYRIIREIGRGGMGVVYEAEQISLDRHVALKLLPATFRLDSKQGLRFVHEAKAAAKLHHTNIVPVFAVGEDDGLRYYAMQFIHGLSLDDVLEELKRIERHAAAPSQASHRASDGASSESLASPSMVFGPEGENDVAAVANSADDRLTDESSRPSLHLDIFTDRSPTSSSTNTGASSSVGSPSSRSEYWYNVAKIGLQVADAIAYAHEHGVIHRDIKPSNLLLDIHNTVWVADFGLAKSDENGSLTHSGDILGTIRYMPPEAFNGQYDGRSDVYSLGITLYELVALQPAFAASDRRELISKVTQGRPTRLKKLRPAIPNDLSTVLQKAIEPEASDRYQTAGDFADDLRRFLADEPIMARRTSTLERLRRWSRRNRGLACSLLGIAGLLLVMACGSFFAAVYFRQQEDTAKQLASEAIDAAGRLDTARQEAVDQKEATRRNLYLSHMTNADQAIEGHRGLRRTLTLLESWQPKPGEPDLRDWEWFYINARCHQEEFSLEGHQAAVMSLSVSPDGNDLLSIDSEGKLILWDVPARKIKRRFEQSFGIGHAVAWGPQGRFVALGTHRGLFILSADTWQVVTKPFARRVLGVSWRPDASMLAFATAQGGQNKNARFMVLSADRWRRHATFPEPSTGLFNVTLSWSPDGEWLAYPAANDVVIRNVAKGTEIARLSGHSRTVQATVFHPHRKGILASTARDADVIVWNVEAAQEVVRLEGHTHAIATIAWDPDGKHLATAAWDATVRLWEADTGRVLHTYQGHDQHVFAVSWDKSADHLLSAGDDNLVKCWCRKGPRTRTRIETPDNIIFGLEFSPDDRDLLASSMVQGRSYLTRFDVLGGAVRWRSDVGRNMTVARWQPEGERIVTVSGNRVELWDATNGALLDGRKTEVTLRDAAWSPSGDRFAICGDPLVQIWSSDLSTCQTLAHSISRVAEVRWRPDGGAVAFIGHSGDIHIHDFELGRRILHDPEAEHIWSIAWDKTGEHLAVASKPNRHIQVWNVAQGNPEETLVGHFEYIPSVRWSPNGKRLLSADARGTLKLWEPYSGVETLSLRSDVGELRAACWSHDGQKIAAAADGVITIWDAARGYQTDLSKP